MISKCHRCGQYRMLTKHSLIGHHKPPFDKICLECHRRVHGQIINKPGRKAHPQQLNPHYR